MRIGDYWQSGRSRPECPRHWKTSPDGLSAGWVCRCAGALWGTAGVPTRVTHALIWFTRGLARAPQGTENCFTRVVTKTHVAERQRDNQMAEGKSNWRVFVNMCHSETRFPISLLLRTCSLMHAFLGMQHGVCSPVLSTTLACKNMLFRAISRP